MRIELDEKLDFSDVLLKPKRSTMTGRHDVELSRQFKFLHSPYKHTGVPIMASNMDGVGTFSMAKVLQEYELLTVIKKHYTLEDWIAAEKLGVNMRYVAVSMGTNAIWDNTAADLQLVKDVLYNFSVPFICIDVANGYQQNFINFVSEIREEFPEKVIIAGNVITPEVVEELLISGADIVKCGIGPGSVCTTRIVAGVGYPQLSGVIECADAAHGVNGHIISDGGCVHPGDVAKAFAGGADFAMLGGMLAGHSEGECEIIQTPKGPHVRFYGMSSKEAVAKHGARKDGYKTTEGRVIEMPFRGNVADTVENILGGVISSCAYIGARRVKDIGKCATFVKVRRTHNEVYTHLDVER